MGIDPLNLAERALNHFREGSTDQSETVMKMPIDAYTDPDRYKREVNRISTDALTEKNVVVILGHHKDDCDENRVEQLSRGHILSDNFSGMTQLKLEPTKNLVLLLLGSLIYDPNTLFVIKIKLFLLSVRNGLKIFILLSNNDVVLMADKP